jgi:hypothetical protein
MLGVCDVALQEVCIWIFNILPNSQESMKGQGMCEMHISSYWKKWSMHKIVQNHPKLSYGLLFLCKQDRCVQQIMIYGSWLKSPSLMTNIVSTNYETLHLAVI